MSPCRICGNANDNTIHEAREMMFGLRDTFRYLECARCGCVQIEEVPANLERYYSDTYYSYAPPKEHPLKRFVKRKRAAYAFGRKNAIGAWLVRRYGAPPFAEWIQKAGVGLDDRILDVGSGSGHLLVDMHQAGFSSLTGIDPYIERDLTYDGGVRILKKSLSEMTGVYDFIMFHHSFEHVADPLDTLRHAHRVLAPEGVILIRIPLAGGYAWRTYGVDWVQLDAPRHLFLHTAESMRLLADQAGLRIEETVYDSHALQFWGSEQYKRDIPYRDERSYRENPAASLFSRADIAAFEARSQTLNEQADGDQACFYMKRVP